MHNPPKVYITIDCESTGLGTYNKAAGVVDFQHQAGADHPVHITEIGAAVYERDSDNPLEIIEEFVLLPDGVEIPEAVVDLNGITTKTCQGRGHELADVLRDVEDMAIKHGADAYVMQNGYLFDDQLFARDRDLPYLPIHDTKLLWAALITGKQCGAHERLDHFYGRMQSKTYGIKSSMSFIYPMLFPTRTSAQTHRALADVFMTASVFQRFIDPAVWGRVFAN